MPIEIRELVIRASVPARGNSAELEQQLERLRRDLLDEVRELLRERQAGANQR
jgi:hypothetical protein